MQNEGTVVKAHEPGEHTSIDGVQRQSVDQRIISAAVKVSKLNTGDGCESRGGESDTHFEYPVLRFLRKKQSAAAVKISVATPMPRDKLPIVLRTTT